MTRRPRSVLWYRLTAMMMRTMAMTSEGKKRPRKLLAPTTTRVRKGSSPPRPANSWANTGMTFQRMIVTTPAAITMIETG